jgi:hypothetical protein
LGYLIKRHSGRQGVNEIRSRLATPHRLTDISPLLHFSRTSERRKHCAGTSLYHHPRHSYPRIQLPLLATLSVQNDFRLSSSRQHSDSKRHRTKYYHSISNTLQDTDANKNDHQRNVTFKIYPLSQTDSDSSEFCIKVGISKHNDDVPTPGSQINYPHPKKLSTVSRSHATQHIYAGWRDETQTTLIYIHI